MTVSGVTGTRSLTLLQAKLAETLMRKYLGATVYAGDANGVDAIARSLTEAGYCVVVFETEGRKPYQLQQRSKRMIDALARENGTLHAFPNKLCPEGITPNSWKSSGTWGTVRYAIAKGIPVELHWLIEPCDLPDWMVEKQLTLIK
jgi:hypothetical protein